jgi:DNA-binding IclR family transcriptional regulator
MEHQSELRRQPILSLLKALDIVAAFTPVEPVLSLADISDRLHLPKATTYNLLATLRSRGYVEKADDGRYCLGRAIIPLTQCVRVNVQIRDRASPLLRSLAQDIHETVYLSVPDGCYCLYIYGVESAKRLLARTAVGDRVHMHCTAAGKAYLAHLPADDVVSLVSSAGMPRFTAHTITDIPALQAELELTRQRGFSLDQEEHEMHTYCLGAAIHSDTGRAIAACSVSGSDPEMLTGRLADLSTKISQCADEISRRMGYVPSRQSELSQASVQPPTDGRYSSRKGETNGNL